MRTEEVRLHRGEVPIATRIAQHGLDARQRRDARDDARERVTLAGDPSYAGFWLPFQDINTNNHIAQWTREVVVIQ